MGIAVAAESDLRIDVGAVDAHGEMHRLPPIVDSGRSNDRPATNATAGLNGRRSQIGVRRLDSAVVDGHRAIPDDDARE